MRCGLPAILALFASRMLGQTHATLLPANPDYAEVVNDHLAGPGVTVLSAGFQTFPYAIGTFYDTIGSIGMSGGLVMATGSVQVIEPPNLSEGTTMGGQTSGLVDADLLQLLNPPAMQWDAAILTIDLIPAGDSLQLRYVFGSEEYDEYVCSMKNDVLGIFLSGPGIAGPHSNGGINIATLPATGLPVCVNSVNSGAPGVYSDGLCWAYPGWQLDSVHHVDNHFGLHCGLDGYTEVLTAKAAVVPGAVYQLRIAIADVHDGLYDSAVFLEAGSLRSELTTGIPAVAGGGTVVWYSSATGEVLLRDASLNGGRVEVQAWDAAGRCVAMTIAHSDGAVWRAPMALASGCYAIRAVQESTVVSGRVMVE